LLSKNKTDRKIKLGVNVDHVATLREARKIDIPDPVEVAFLAETAGCNSIVVHLRKDLRHIKEEDVRLLKENVKTRLNLEMSIDPEIVDIALDISPDQVTFVPEKRQEITTEGGLDVEGNFKNIKNAVEKFLEKNINVSLFIDPDKVQVDHSYKTGANSIELHTGRYVNAKGQDKDNQLSCLIKAAEVSNSLGLIVNAGHGLDYRNVLPIVKLPFLEELNIGHSVIARSVYVGITKAVEEMIDLIT